jgi:hypothetical protein
LRSRPSFFRHLLLAHLRADRPRLGRRVRLFGFDQLDGDEISRHEFRDFSLGHWWN